MIIDQYMAFGWPVNLRELMTIYDLLHKGLFFKHKSCLCNDYSYLRLSFNHFENLYLLENHYNVCCCFRFSAWHTNVGVPMCVFLNPSRPLRSQVWVSSKFKALQSSHDKNSCNLFFSMPCDEKALTHLNLRKPKEHNGWNNCAWSWSLTMFYKAASVISSARFVTERFNLFWRKNPTWFIGTVSLTEHFVIYQACTLLTLCAYIYIFNYSQAT